MDEVSDELGSTQASANASQPVIEQQALNMFERVVDQITEMLNEQLNKLKITLNEA